MASAKGGGGVGVFRCLFRALAVLSKKTATRIEAGRAPVQRGFHAPKKDRAGKRSERGGQDHSKKQEGLG